MLKTLTSLQNFRGRFSRRRFQYASTFDRVCRFRFRNGLHFPLSRGRADHRSNDD
uniref:Uncharacterized protein n=1 Tax=Romanomermis culicivorax TaxID=13658 RepID=A0A915J2J5_ROMCU